MSDQVSAEDTAISLTPALFQLAFMSWLAYDGLTRYHHSGRPIELIPALAIIICLPLFLSRLRTAWRDRHFSTRAT